MANLPPPALKRNNSGGFEQRIARGPDDSKGFRGAGRGSGPIPKSAGLAALSAGPPVPTPSTPVAAAQETPAVDTSRESAIAAARAKAAEDAIRKQKQLDAAARVQNSQAIIPTLPVSNSSSQRKLIEAAMEEAARKKKQLEMAARNQAAPTLESDQDSRMKDRILDPQSGDKGQFDNVKPDPSSMHKQLLMQAAEDAKRKQRQLEAAAKAQTYSAPISSNTNLVSNQQVASDPQIISSSDYDPYAEKQAKEKSAAQRKREEAMEEAQRKQRQLEAAALAQSILPSSKNLVLQKTFEAEEMARRQRHLEEAAELAARRQRQLAAAAHAQDSLLPGSLSRESSMTKNDMVMKPAPVPEKNAWATNKPLANSNVAQPPPNAWGVNTNAVVQGRDAAVPRDQPGVSWSKVAAGHNPNGSILNTDGPGVLDTSEDTEEVFCYGSNGVDQGGGDDGVPQSWEDSIPQPEPVRESAWKKPLKILGVETGRPNEESILGVNGEDFKQQQAALDFATGFGQVSGCDDLMPFELTCDLDGPGDKERNSGRPENPSGSSALSEDEGDSQSPSIALKMLLGIGQETAEIPVQNLDRKLPVWGKPGMRMDITLDPAVAQISAERPDGMPANSAWHGDGHTPVSQLQTSFQNLGKPTENDYGLSQHSSSGFFGSRQDMGLGASELHTPFSGTRQDMYSMPSTGSASSDTISWLSNQNQNVDWFSNVAPQRPSFSFQDNYNQQMETRSSAANAAPGSFGSYPSNTGMNGFDFHQGSMLGNSTSTFNSDPFSSSQRMGYGLGQVEHSGFQTFAQSDARSSRANGDSFLSAPSSFIVPSAHQPTGMQGGSNQRGPWDQQPAGYGYSSGFSSGGAGNLGGAQAGYDRGYMPSNMLPGEMNSRQYGGERLDQHGSSQNVLRLFGMAGGTADLRDEEPNLSGLAIGDEHLLKPEAFTRFQEPSGHGGLWGQGGPHGDNNFNFSKFFGGLAGNGEVQPMPSIPPSTGMMSLAEIEGKQFRT